MMLTFWAGTLAAQTAPAALPVSGAVGDGPPADGGSWSASNGASARVVAGLSSEAPTLDAHQVKAPAAAVPVRSGGKDMLPNDQGQVWQQYDISAYTSKVQGVEHPEQAIVDWILRETGTEVWFTQPLGLLNADHTTLSVYHTPEMQRIVAEVVGRFINGTQDPHVLGLRLVAVGSPNWRANYQYRMQSIAVQSPGIEAWLVSREDAALMLGELRRRADFREHTISNLVFYNGQVQTVSQLRPRGYIRSYRTRPPESAWMGYDVERVQLQEGFSLQISPLLSQDERTIDAVLKCNIDQVEKFVPVGIDLPGFNGQVQRAEIQVPQMVSWRLHERFRWPSNQILLLSCGVVASPGPDRPTTLGLPIPNPFSTAGRADALLFVEGMGKASQAILSGQTTTVGGRVMNQGARY